MSRTTFCRELKVDYSTERRARTEGLPWPPFKTIGARVYYSRELVTRWFEEQAAVGIDPPSNEAPADTEPKLATIRGP